MDIDKATATDYSSQDAYEVDTAETDGISETTETVWNNPDWSTYWGYFNEVGDLKSALLMKSVWTVGKGWKADNATTSQLENINGWGKDTFDDILFNMDLIKNVGGDSFAQVIRNDKGTLINLKPLDPGQMTIVLNMQGIIIRYEQRSKVPGKKPVPYQPNDIFHLSNNRLADQIHGISDIEALKKTILAEQESFDDMQKLMHFQVKPFILFKIKSDNQAKINEIVTKIENIRKLGEDLFLPDDDDIVSYEVIQVNPSNILMEWRDSLKNKFYRQVGMPEILFGTSGATESGGKMEVFAHETVFEHNQRYIEKQLWNQLAIKIDLIPPSSLLEGLQTDEKKDAGFQTQAAKPNEVSAPAPEAGL